MSRDKGDESGSKLRFGDINADDGSGGPNWADKFSDDPTDFAIEVFRLLFVLMILIYVAMAIAHTLFGTPDPNVFF